MRPTSRNARFVLDTKFKSVLYFSKILFHLQYAEDLFPLDNTPEIK